MKPLKIFAIAVIGSFTTVSCMSNEAQEAEPKTDKTETPLDATNTDETNPAGLDENVQPVDGAQHHNYDSDEDPIGDTMPVK